MKTLSVFNRRAGAVFATAALVLSTTVPALVSAATVTERSVELSTSTKKATASYTVSFKGMASADAFAVDFCTTPTIGAACTVPAGFSTAGATSSDTINKVANGVVTVTKGVTNGGTTTTTLNSIVNSDDAGVVYARITTYATANLAGHESATVVGTYVDSGAAAFSITDGIQVQGAVLESLIFCASGTALSASDCSDTSAPNLTLGTGGVLSNTTVGGIGSVYTLLSTNAAGGASVNLKNDVQGCGGLMLQGQPNPTTGCNIKPATTAKALTNAEAEFGAKVILTHGTGAAATLTGSWTASNYYMNYVVGDATGVTSVYGDEVMSIAGPAANEKAQIDFGANAAPLTPAGKYTANLSLIATGKF